MSGSRHDAQRHFRLTQDLGEERIGLEARALLNDHADIKLWLRLFSCSIQIEQQISQMLRQQYDMTLPRFDYMAQLERHPEGLRMNVLSRYLMVTGGNITGLTDQLVKEALVERVQDPDDRRSFRVRLTAKGQALFADMAAQHEHMLIGLFKGLETSSKNLLYEHLGKLRLHLAQNQSAQEQDAKSATTTSRRHPA